MTEQLTLTDQQNAEANDLGSQRQVWGDIVKDARQKTAEAKAMKLGRVRSIVQKTKAHRINEKIEREALLERGAIASNKIVEAAATDHYLEYKDAYQEQALAEAREAGVEITFGQNPPAQPAEAPEQSNPQLKSV